MLPYFLLELGQRLNRLETETWMSWRFGLLGTKSDMNLLAFGSNVKPRAHSVISRSFCNDREVVC
jgi:hypothetical protein